MIGIGAGPATDGQVLVWQDMLGLSEGFRPKFLRTFAELGADVKKALNDYDSQVKNGGFPNAKESYN
jgi:3-methyl-2-oxobutanoate hydroxymethyltransferase